MEDKCPYDRLLESPYGRFPGVLGDARLVRGTREILEIDGADHVFHITGSFQFGFYREITPIITNPEMMMYELSVGTYCLFARISALRHANLEEVDSVFLFSSAGGKKMMASLVDFGQLHKRDEKTKDFFNLEPPQRSRNDLVDLLKSLTK